MDRHLSPSRLSSLLVPLLRHLGGYQPPKQTSPHCRAGQIANAIWKGLRPSHRRDFRLAIYLPPAPTLANFNHLADRRGRADNARTASTRHRELNPGLARASLFSRRHRLSVHVGRRSYPPLCVSTCPPPSGPQFPVAKKWRLISRYEGTRSRYPVTLSCPGLAPSPENLTSKRLLAFRG